jgi:hypothetical protein
MYQDVIVTPCVSRATVVGLRSRALLLQCGGETREATLALGVPYVPTVGDEVLALCGEEAWVVGVLRAQQPISFHVNGPLTIEATGAVRIVSGQSLELRAPLCRVNAGRFETLAHVVVQRAVDTYTWVQGLVQVFAGRHRTVVEADSVLRARHVRQFAEKDVKIDGEQIKLG